MSVFTFRGGDLLLGSSPSLNVTDLGLALEDLLLRTACFDFMRERRSRRKATLRSVKPTEKN